MSTLFRMSRERVQVIERATDILEILAEGAATLTEISSRTGLPKGTAFRILSSLGYGDRVLKDPLTNRYVLGPGTWRLAQAASDALGSLALIARPELTAIWQATAETVTLNMRMGLERVCIAELRSPHPLLHTAGVGSRIPLHVGASGKVILAFTDDEQRERILDCLTYEPITSATISGRQQLVEELALVRQRGWAMSMGERIPGAAGVSVPVRGASGPVLSLSLLGPAERLTADRRSEITSLLLETAQAIEAREKAAAAGESPPEA
jgi:DNA-binding IclR family transcriptional regulator